MRAPLDRRVKLAISSSSACGDDSNDGSDDDENHSNNTNNHRYHRRQRIIRIICQSMSTTMYDTVQTVAPSENVCHKFLITASNTDIRILKILSPTYCALNCEIYSQL